MTRSRGLLAVGTVVALALAFTAGRYSRPARVVTRTETVTVEKRVEVAAAVTETKADAGTRVVERRVYVPGGRVVVTRTEDHRDTHETRVATTESRVQAVARAETRTLEAPRPSWSVGAAAGIGLDGRLHYGGSVERRLFGGVWTGVHVDMISRSALLGLRFEY